MKTALDTKIMAWIIIGKMFLSPDFKPFGMNLMAIMKLKVVLHRPVFK